MQLKIKYWAGNHFINLTPQTELGTGFHYKGPFGKMRVDQLSGESARFYFVFLKIGQPARLQFNIQFQSIFLLVSEGDAFIHLWNSQLRWLPKTLGDVFYNPENFFGLEFPGSGTYVFSLVQIYLRALKPLQTLNGPIQLLVNKGSTRQMICLNSLPFMVGVEEKVMLENLRLNKDILNSRIFITSQALLFFIRIVEKLIRKSLEFSDGPFRDYDQENLERAAVEIMADPGQKISIPELSKKAGLNSSRFKFLFKKQFRLTIHTFVMKIRAKRAEELIIQTQLSIREIALRIGYSNDSTFSTFFKKQTGLTPTALRRKSGR